MNRFAYHLPHTLQPLELEDFQHKKDKPRQFKF
jgi:hypothetical protein